MRKASKTRRLLEKGGFALPPPSPPQPTRASRRNTMTTKSCPRRPRPAAFGSSPAVGHDDALYGVRRDGAFFLGAVIGGGGRGRRWRDNELERDGGDVEATTTTHGEGGSSQSRQRREQRRQLRTEVIDATACSFWGLASARRCRCHRRRCVDAPSPGGSSA